MASEHNENKDAFQKDANCLLAATICASIATKCHHQLGVLKWTSWTGLQWWPPGVTSRGSLYSEVTCPGGSLYSEVPCLDGGWAGGFLAQWGPMSGGGRAVCVCGGGVCALRSNASWVVVRWDSLPPWTEWQTDACPVKTLPSRNFVGRR